MSSTEDPSEVDLTTTPAIPPPPGVVPDFDNPESLSYLPRNLMFAFAPLMILALFSRLWCRWRTRQKLGWDDYLAIASVVSTMAYCGIVGASYDHLFGVHLYEMPMSDLNSVWFEMLIAFCNLSGVSLLLVKLALLVLYLRIFSPVYSIRITIYSCIGILTAFYLGTCIAYIVECVPETRQDVVTSLNAGTCIPSAIRITLVRNIFGAVSDFVIIVIPMTQVLKLGLVRRKKFAVAATFLTGLIPCGCSLANCFVRIGHTGRNGYRDYTWANTVPVTFTIVELTIGNICCSLPVMAPLVKAICRHQFIRRVFRLPPPKNHGSKSLSISEPSSMRSVNSSRRDPEDQATGLPPMNPIAYLPRRFSLSKSTNVARRRDSITYDDLETDYHAQLKSSVGVSGDPGGH